MPNGVPDGVPDRVPDGVPEGVTHWDGPGLDRWVPWTPAEAMAELGGVDVPWCVVGGWSIDLHLGRVTREHEDLELAFLRPDIVTVRAALSAYAIHAVGDGEVVRLAPDEDAPPGKHQHWVLDEAADAGLGAWRVDLMAEPGDEQTWVYRRDERITAPRASMVGRTADGIPYLLPHGSLLYKAKDPRPKDEADFTAVLTAGSHGLTERGRTWLAAEIERLHPTHPWLARLAGRGR